jgi:excisionase family DNA binding protein
MSMTTHRDAGGFNHVEQMQRHNPGCILGQMLTAKQAAAQLRITTKTLYRHMNDGTAPGHFRYGGRVLFKLSDVLAYSAQQGC